MPGICQLYFPLNTSKQASIPANSEVEIRVLTTYFGFWSSARLPVTTLNHETVTEVAVLIRVDEARLHVAHDASLGDLLRCVQLAVRNEIAPNHSADGW